LAKWRKKNGLPPPKHAALQHVDLDPKHLDLWDAFLELKGSAASGLGSSTITASDVHAWCVMNAIPQERWGMFWRVCHHLDGVARKAMHEREKSHD
jgi:hypothetical protein